MHCNHYTLFLRVDPHGNVTIHGIGGTWRSMGCGPTELTVDRHWLSTVKICQAGLERVERVVWTTTSHWPIRLRASKMSTHKNSSGAACRLFFIVKIALVCDDDKKVSHSLVLRQQDGLDPRPTKIWPPIFGIHQLTGGEAMRSMLSFYSISLWFSGFLYTSPDKDAQWQDQEYLVRLNHI